MPFLLTFPSFFLLCHTTLKMHVNQTCDSQAVYTIYKKKQNKNTFSHHIVWGEALQSERRKVLNKKKELKEECD